MNDKLQRVALVALAAGILSVASSAHSLELPYFLLDPLRTMPGVVEKGVILPGDTIPIPQTLQKDFAQQLTLIEVVDLALSNNQKVKFAWADIKVQAGALGEARATYLPTISGVISWTRDNISYSDSRSASTTSDLYTGQASASLRLIDFGGRAANRRAAENALASALASHDATLQEVLASVIQSYFDTVTAKASLVAKTKNENIAQNTLNSAKAKEANGAISQSDTLRATTALARASLDRNRTQGEYQKKLAILRHGLGLSGATELLLPSELNEPIDGGAIESKELSLWLDEAQKSHPSVLMAKKQLEMAQEQVTVVQSVGLPTINLSGNFYQNTRPGDAVTSSGAQETTLVVNMIIPFFDGFASTYKLRGAQAQVEKKKAALYDMEQQVAMDVIKSYADTTSSLRNLGASKILLEAAQNSLAVSQRKYDKGASDITEVLSTQSALADAWNERVRCLAEWHSAKLQLLANAGKMGRHAVTSAANTNPGGIAF